MQQKHLNSASKSTDQTRQNTVRPSDLGRSLEIGRRPTWVKTYSKALKPGLVGESVTLRSDLSIPKVWPKIHVTSDLKDSHWKGPWDFRVSRSSGMLLREVEGRQWQRRRRVGG